MSMKWELSILPTHNENGVLESGNSATHYEL